MKHTHHIIPRHMGGTDDPSNLVELTVEEHAEAHRILYEQHGRWQDKVAWQGLVGLIGHDEIMQEMWNARRGEGNHFYGKKHTDEYKRRMSELKKGQGAGIPKSEETRKRMRENHHRCRAGKDPWNKGKTGTRTRTLAEMESFSIKIVYEGKEYPSLKAASRATGISPYKLKKLTSK
jgi:hypothetical protein